MLQKERDETTLARYALVWTYGTFLTSLVAQPATDFDNKNFVKSTQDFCFDFVWWHSSLFGNYQKPYFGIFWSTKLVLCFDGFDNNVQQYLKIWKVRAKLVSFLEF